MLNLNEEPINNGRVQNPQPEQQLSGGGGNRALWIVFAMLVGILCGAGAYGYRALKNHGVELAQLPSMLQSITGLNDRVAGIETRLASWTEEKQALLDRLARLDQKMDSNLQKARKHADVVTAQLEERIVDQTDGRRAIVDARLDKIEVAQTAEHVQLVRLQNELASARQEIASLRNGTGRELAGLDERLKENGQRVERVAQQLRRRRVDFEASRNVPTEIASGIALKVNDTDVRHQKFSGWVQILPEARFLWVSDQGALQPVEFYRERDGRRFDLVATRVAGNSVVGYLLVPIAAAEGSSSPGEQSGPVALPSVPYGQAGR